LPRKSIVQIIGTAGTCRKIPNPKRTPIKIASVLVEYFAEYFFGEKTSLINLNLIVSTNTMKSPGHLSLGAIAMGWLTRIPRVHAMPSIQALPKLCSQGSVTVARNVSSIWPWQEYISSSARPPYLEINATGEELAPGLISFDPQTGINFESYIPDKAPFIMTDAGDLVWSGPVTPDASNFRVQKLFGQPVVTYWAGSGGAAESSSASHGYGHIVIHNSSYDQIGVFCPKLNLTLPPGTSAPCQADVYESLITEDNTILITAYNRTNADLRDLGGSEDGWVLDSLVLKIDLQTSEIRVHLESSSSCANK
jgi:hypothetical protein